MERWGMENGGKVRGKSGNEGGLKVKCKREGGVEEIGLRSKM
ncbi:hypothetical protein [Pedobacter sp. N23S346]